MAYQLSNVVGILDMDSFTIKKRFYCKELGILKIGDAAAQSVFFHIGVRWRDLTARDRKRCKYVMRYIYKLPFDVPRDVRATELSALERTVKRFYDSSTRPAL